MRQKGSCRNREVMPDDMSGKDEGQSISDPEDPSALTQDLEELLKLWAVDGEDGGTDLPKDAFRGMREESPRETEGAEQVSEANETGKLRDEGPQLSVTGRRAKSRKRISKPWRGGICIAAFWLLALYAIFQYFLGVTVLSGNSMRPALCHGDILLYQRFGIRKPERGDVLIIRNGDGNGTVVAKRVIAVAGDTVSVDDYGHVTLNGMPLHEPEVLYGYQPGDEWIKFPVTLDEGTFFYLGENRPVSMDSRNATIAAGTMEEVQGRVLSVFRLKPP